MVFQWYTYHLLTLISCLTAVLLSGYLFVHRNKTGAWYSLGILTMMFLWSAAQGFEFAVQDINDKLLFANIQYLPITIIPILYFYLSISFSRKEYLLKKRYLPYLLLITPVILNILIWMDSYYNLLRKEVHLNTSGIVPTVEKKFGLLMIPFATYNFSLTIITLAILYNTWKDKNFHYRNQAKYLLIGLLLPTVTNFMHYLGFDFFNIDLTPFSFVITGVLITRGIFRHGLFDLVPIALSHIFNEMKQGLIVFDTYHRVIDINPAANHMLVLNEESVIGKSVSEAFAHVPELIKVMEEEQNSKQEIAYCKDEIKSFFEITVTAVKNKKEKNIGWMAQVYDITERKSAEEQLRQDKENAMTLYRIAEKTSVSNESAFLQAQIKPHFLYNALNVIAVLCRMDPEKARELLLDLSNYMHHNFDFRNLERYIAFEEELELIRSYVRIEQARFKERLNVVYEIDEIEDLLLPPLLLQPLVENAIRHGICKSVTGSTVYLRVKNMQEYYQIEIEDDGAGMTVEQLESIQEGRESEGVGVANIQRRLKMLYQTTLSIESQYGKGTKVSILLPKKRMDSE